MPPKTATIRIDRNPIEVFYFLDDVTREHEWQANLRSAEQDPTGPSRVGTLKRYTSTFMGKEIENVYRVVEVEPGRRMVTESTPESAVEARYEIVVAPDGVGTEVTFSVEAAPRGVLKMMPRAVMEAAFQKELIGSLERLKACLEGSG